MATYLGYPFNPELFNYNWANEKDPVLTAMLSSGSVQNNAELKNLIANGSDLYTLPFYKMIGGTPENYDGATTITVTDPTGSSQSGIVYGRAHGWREVDFVVDYNSGADPMKQITSQVAGYWQKQRQSIMLKILSAIFGITGAGEFADWELHKTNIATTTTSATSANKLGATSLGDAIVKAVGDASGAFSLAVMHSKVAGNLAGLQLLEYRKYTDILGIERRLNVADVNGLTVVIDDGVPVTASATAAGENDYTTYLFGLGALQYAPAPVKVPSELDRDALVAGGATSLITRIRETIHPNGFTFVKPVSGYTSSPTDAQLALTANWIGAANPKNIAMARVVSNG